MTMEHELVCSEAVGKFIPSFASIHLHNIEYLVLKLELFAFSFKLPSLAFIFFL